MKGPFFGKHWVVFIIVILMFSINAVAVRAEELAAEQVARLAVGVDDIGTVDPHFAVKYGEAPIYRSVYEALLRFPDGEINMEKIGPSLAERWEVESDKLTWTFHLRKGVKWHEGYGELTAEDVKFSIDRVKNPDVGSPFRKNLDVVESVSIVDPYTVKIKTNRVYPDLPALMVDYQGGFILCKKAVEKLGKDIKFHPVGTGPFRHHSYKPKESFTLVRNDDYWQGKPNLEKIVVSFIPDSSTRELALKTGEVDAIEIPAKQEWVDRLRKEDFEVNLTSPANMFVLYFNMSKKPMDDIKVRKALCHAINRQELINFLGKDVAKPEYSPLPAGYVGYTEDVVRYAYDPEKAKKLLAEAGYAEGFSLSMAISNSVIYLPPMQVIQEQWKKVGVKLELNVIDHPTYHKMIRQNLNPVVIYGAYRYPLTGNVYLTQFYHSDSIVGKPTAVVNFSHYGDIIPGVDEYIDDARLELDVKKQKELWTKAQQQIKQDAVAFPLFTRAYTMAKAKYLDLGFEQKSRYIYDFIYKTRILKH